MSEELNNSLPIDEVEEIKTSQPIVDTEIKITQILSNVAKQFTAMVCNDLKRKTHELPPCKISVTNNLFTLQALTKTENNITTADKTVTNVTPNESTSNVECNSKGNVENSIINNVATTQTIDSTIAPEINNTKVESPIVQTKEKTESSTTKVTSKKQGKPHFKRKYFKHKKLNNKKNAANASKTDGVSITTENNDNGKKIREVIERKITEEPTEKVVNSGKINKEAKEESKPETQKKKIHRRKSFNKKKYAKYPGNFMNGLVYVNGSLPQAPIMFANQPNFKSNKYNEPFLAVNPNYVPITYQQPFNMRSKHNYRNNNVNTLNINGIIPKQKFYKSNWNKKADDYYEEYYKNNPFPKKNKFQDKNVNENVDSKMNVKENENENGNENVNIIDKENANVTDIVNIIEKNNLTSTSLSTIVDSN